jgi:succinate dehydrogenase / fumarate reductase flavoprotein subunit
VAAPQLPWVSLGTRVEAFCYQDSPRRAHSIAAQGGINAAKNYQNDGDTVFRLFYDTIKGGDFRAREANVYRLAEISNHHRPVRGPGRAVRPRVQRVLLGNRTFGGAQVSGRSTPAARPASNCCWGRTTRSMPRSTPAR